MANAYITGIPEFRTHMLAALGAEYWRLVYHTISGVWHRFYCPRTGKAVVVHQSVWNMRNLELTSGHWRLVLCQDGHTYCVSLPQSVIDTVKSESAWLEYLCR